MADDDFPPRGLGERVAELAALPHRPGVAASPPARTAPPEEFDVIVVGSGASALAGAAGALEAGASVVVLEKGPVHGGTTACSGGVAHIYANRRMQSLGLDDRREDALAYMARVGFPSTYDPEAPRLGLSVHSYGLLDTYYRRGTEVMDRLGAIGAAPMEMPWLAWDGQDFPDYYEFPENKVPRGRGVQIRTPDGGRGNGGELVRQLATFANQYGAPIRLSHRVVDLIVTDGAVSGVVVDDGTACRRMVAHGGVVFGSGGFAHDAELRARFLHGPVAGGSGVPSNTGDLVRMGSRAGASFGGMYHGWWNQQVLEAVDDYANSVLDVWAIPGDSMVLVNRLGRRAVGEKREYASRGQVHHVYADDEYVNRVMFMVYDARCAERFGGRYPLPPAGAVAPHVVSGEGVAGLTAALTDRLRRLRGHMPTGIAPVELTPSFADTLRVTLQRFNAMAEDGRDTEFERGTKAVEFAFHGPPAGDNHLPNSLLYPLDLEGRLFAICLVGTAFDTNVGPRIGSEGQILGEDGPIDGLYGAGNCVDGVFGEGYPGGGSTIGPGLVFGFLAGGHAGRRSPRVARP
jgi:succinate dehydrogenase/fumarate reductase flavoprotein subunit